MDVSTFESTEWYKELFAEVGAELTKLIKADDGGESLLRRELDELRLRKEGWQVSLGDPKLPASLRVTMQADWEKADRREQELVQQLSARRSAQECIDQLLSPAVLLERLQRLPQILANNNPSRCNLELALHIDHIECDAEGKVVMRTCRLGALAGAVALLREDASPKEADRTAGVTDETRNARRGPRRRRRLRVDSVGSDRRELIGTAEFATDPNRYAGLPESWFWEDTFQKPENFSWAAEHGLEVAEARLRGLTHKELEDEFGKTTPTIRAAIEHAKEIDPTMAERLAALPWRMPRSQWHVDHADEVWHFAEELKRTKGMKITPMKELVQHFRKSDVTIRKALEVARQCRAAS